MIMPRSAQNILYWSSKRTQYLLRDAENGEPRSLTVEDGEDWLQWLEEHRSFAFHGRNGQINLLKEKRVRGGEG